MLSFFFIFFESKRPILVPRTRLGTRGQGGRQSWVLSILLPQAGSEDVVRFDDGAASALVEPATPSRARCCCIQP